MMDIQTGSSIELLLTKKTDIGLSEVHALPLGIAAITSLPLIVFFSSSFSHCYFPPRRGCPMSVKFCMKP